MEQLHMSLASAILIAAVAAVRSTAGRRIPRTMLLPLWGAALVRLLLPLSIPSPLSIFNLFDTMAGTVVAAVGSPPASRSANGVLWLGTAALALVFLWSYCRSLRQFRFSQPVTNAACAHWLARHPLRRCMRMRVSAAVDSPLTFGIVRPVILLPESALLLGEAELDCILSHELVHIRRFDAFWKLAMAAALCLHWFNPFAWLMSVLANRDLELSCDERVLRRLDKKQKALYARLLLAMEECKRMNSPLYSGFCKNAIEERIVAIMNMKKMTMAGVLLAVALTTSTLAVFATSAQPAAVAVSASAVSIDAGEISKTTGKSDQLIISVTGEDGKPVSLSGSEIVKENGDGTYTIRVTDLQNSGPAGSVQTVSEDGATISITPKTK